MANENNRNIDKRLPDYGVLIESREKRLTGSNPVHSHSHPSLLYIISGSGILECENKQYDIEADSIITLANDKSHKLIDKPRKQMTIFSIYFEEQKTRLNKYIVDYLLNSDESFALPLFYSENIKRHLRQMLFEQNTKPPGYKISISQNLSLVILQIYRAKLNLKVSAKMPDSKERVKAVIDFITGNYHEQYGLADAARLGKVSQRQFTNLCRNLTGKSYIKFLNSVRCQKAAELIKQTEMQIAAIAFESGYEDLSTFYRAFKKIYKRSPMDFKKV